MIVELERFVAFNDKWDWPKLGEKGNQDGLTFAPITINTDYIAWAQRYPISGGFEFTEVGMVDWRTSFVIAAVYEYIRGLMRKEISPEGARIQKVLR